MLAYEARHASPQDVWQNELVDILDRAREEFARSPSPKIVDWLAVRMGALFDIAQAEDSQPAFNKICQSHPLAQTILEDPYSRRAHDKPRGYAGDAVMLDFIYRPQSIVASDVGRAVHQATTNLPNAKSILWRRDYLARNIADATRKHRPARVLAVASGHMRELDVLPERSKREDLQIYAVDQDRLSLMECTAAYPDTDIRTVNSSAVAIRRAKLPGDFHLVYCAGLFDYLNDATAEFLLAQLYRELSQDGLLCVANFTPTNHGRGFMEGFMNWSLILRSEAALRRIASNALSGASLSTFSDPMRNVAYLEIRKS